MGRTRQPKPSLGRAPAAGTGWRLQHRARHTAADAPSTALQSTPADGTPPSLNPASVAAQAASGSRATRASSWSRMSLVRGALANCGAVGIQPARAGAQAALQYHRWQSCWLPLELAPPLVQGGLAAHNAGWLKALRSRIRARQAHQQSGQGGCSFPWFAGQQTVSALSEAVWNKG